MICPHCYTQLPEPYALDWLTMPIDAQLAAIASAPSVAGPWTETHGGWVRETVYPVTRSRATTARVRESAVPGTWIGHARSEIVGLYSSVDEARVAVDLALVGVGWRLM